MRKRAIGVLDHFVLAGMAIQGTPQAQSVLFVDRDVITSLSESKRRFELKRARQLQPFFRPAFGEAQALPFDLPT